MNETLLTRTPRNELESRWQAAWDALNKLTGSATFVEVFAQAPQALDLVMNQFYMNLFFGGKVAQRYKQLARLKLSLLHGCRTCNQQNVPGALGAGFTQAQIDALIDSNDGPFTAAERAVIDYASRVALTNMEGEMTRELFSSLRAHFSGRRSSSSAR
jgi:alkylhydroperoxidase family enzyme